jgi:hypothetical protein
MIREQEKKGEERAGFSNPLQGNTLNYLKTSR